jgi:predicted O-methyltransferase YrrM
VRCAAEDHNHRFRLLLVGDGPLRDELVTLAAASGLEDAVTFLGRRTDVPELLAAADLFVLASHFEGMPLCVLEAYASRLPVIATAVGNIPVMVPPSLHEWLVEPGEVDSLAERIVDMLSKSDDERAAIGERGRAHVADNFGFDAYASSWRSVYVAAAARSPRRCASPAGALVRAQFDTERMTNFHTSPSTPGGPMDQSTVRKAMSIARSVPDRDRRNELVRKVRHRIGGRGERREMAEARQWSQQREVLPEDVMVDATIREEAAAFARGLAEHARSIPEVGTMGGAGAVELLYYLARTLRPSTVVETGVAAGWSSAAFLAALDRNGGGALHSSDFPYPGLKDSERLVGIVVPADLRHRWSLHTSGDRVNLPRIVAQCGQIDLFHYDSDKTRDGRRYALDLITPQLSPGAVVLFDDIDDNLHFARLAESSSWRPLVIRSGRKHVGLLATDETLAVLEAVLR